MMNLDAQVSAREAAGYPPMVNAGVCRHLIYVWRAQGRLSPVGQRGRSPLYRWGDLADVEWETRTSGTSHRSSRCRSCERAAERERMLVSA